MASYLLSANNFRRRMMEDKLLWLRPAVVIGVLAVSALLPMVLAPSRQMLLLGALAGLGVVLIFLRWPPLGFLALIVTGFLIPSPNLPGGLNFSALLLALLIGLWIFDMVARQREFTLVRSRTFVPLVLFLVVALVSFGIGQLPWFALAQHAPLEAQIGALMIFVLSAAAYMWVATEIRDIRWLEYAVWLFLVIGAVFVLGWLVGPLGQFTGRIYQIGATSNAMFWTWMVALAFSQSLYNTKLHLFWRGVLMLLVLVTIFVAFVLGYDWKSGWMPPLAAIGAIVAFRSWKFIVLMGLAAIAPTIYLSTRAVSSDEYSYSTRLDAWIIVLNMVKVNPIFGLGPANYYWYTPLFPIRGYRVSFNSHNQYVDIVAQTGLLGLAALSWFAWEVGHLGWRLRTRVPKGFAEAYVYGALGGLAGTIVSGVLVDWFLPFVYNIGFNGFRSSILTWLFLGGLVAIEQMTRKSAEDALEGQVALGS